MEQQVVVPVPKEQQYQGFYSHIFVVRKPSGVSADSKLKKPEQVPGIQKVYYGEYLLRTQKTHEGGLHDDSGHQGCLPACANSHGSSGIPEVRGSSRRGGFSLAVQSSSIRVKSQPKEFYKNPSRGSSLSTSPGYISLIPYLDDILISAPSATQVRSDTNKVMSVLKNLGWVINTEKSSLEPDQVKTFLGYRVDTRLQKLFLPEDKVTLALIPRVLQKLSQSPGQLLLIAH